VHWICLADLTSHNRLAAATTVPGHGGLHQNTARRSEYESQAEWSIAEAQNPRSLTGVSMHQALRGCPPGNSKVSPRLTNGHSHPAQTQTGNL